MRYPAAELLFSYICLLIFTYIYIEIHNYIYMENPPIKVDGFPGGKPWLFFTNSCFAKLLEGYRTSKVRRGPEMASGVRSFYTFEFRISRGPTTCQQATTRMIKTIDVRSHGPPDCWLPMPWICMDMSCHVNLRKVVLKFPCPEPRNIGNIECSTHRTPKSW